MVRAASRITGAGLVLVLVAAVCAAAELQLGYGWWTWTEDDGSPGSSVRESGPMIRLGTGWAWAGPRWGLRGGIEAWHAEVDYDGSTQSGEPSRTTTEYLGLDLQAGPCAVWRTGRDRWEGSLLFAGRLRLRDIDNSSRFSSGYREAWQAWYALLGGRWERVLRTGDAVSAGLAMGFPFYQQAAYSLSFEEDRRQVNLEPGGRPLYLLDASYRWGGVRAELFHEAWSHGESSSVERGPYLVFQPAAEGRVSGIRLVRNW